MTFKNTPCPEHSPWGAIETRDEIAPGIWSVSTASHGGLHLSDERMAHIPEHMRVTRYSPGNWFEEDCDWAIVAVTFPEHFSQNAVSFAFSYLDSLDEREPLS